jgi:bifunctional UDP-N-acetylglucosamine pyrophosphorylase/glucosamine-1-phosphate N-acetyltransferase
MSLYQVEKTEGLGLVEVDESKVISIREKVTDSPSRLANAGLYLFTPEIFGAVSKTPLSPRGEYELTSSLQSLIDGGGVVRYRKLGFWLEASYPWDLLTANELMLAAMEPDNSGEVEEFAVLRGPVSLGSGTVVKSGSYIEGPVIIGRNCRIGPNCYIRASTSIGDNCHIGASVEVKNSIIMNDTKVPHHNYVGDSVIGERCNLGSGTKVANLKMDNKEVVVGRIATGRRKLGVIMGDDVSTGINSSINVGTIIGNRVRIGPGALAHGVIAPNSKIF